MMIIDSHAHVMQPTERQRQWMTEAKVDRTVLFTSTIHPETASTMEAFEGELHKLHAILSGATNPLEERKRAIQELVAVIEKEPDRYIGFGPLPLGLSDRENLQWIEEQILAHHLRGIGELTPGTGKIDLLKPVFHAAREAGNLPLWVHAFAPLNFEDIKALLDLAKDHPTVPLIVGHLGGSYWLETLKAVKDLPQVYLDLSATFTTMAPSFAIQRYPERTLFGSDAPYTTPLAARTIIEQVVKDRHVLERVLGDNIAELLRL